MASLDRNLRKNLENAVKKARRVADAGARQVLEQLAVGHHEPWGALTPEQRKLRNRLRAHGRQLGDRLDEKKGTQAIDRLAGECAYEHWHRLLFARFLAENELLVEPGSGMALSLDECRELARERERGEDWLSLASDFAQRMLPQIFRAGDPVLEVTLPPEKRQELEALLEALPRDVFTTDDSLGWVYQFWQAEEKDRVNKSEKKIGADELPAVTQLFTEDYMVLFLLHNTLGAWWAGKVLAERPELARAATSEDELRAACALPGVGWSYLRFVKDDETWRPAAGTFEGWPKVAKDITVLDPCMGSGHFLVFALPIVAALRVAEEGLSTDAAVDAVLGENLFGLEIDPRCTQIAAFNLAFAAWRVGGYRVLPRLHLACSGLSVGAKESDWLALANGDARLQAGMKRLYDLFQQGPTLGSLIDPSAMGGDLLEAGFGDLAPLLERAVTRERADDVAHEMAIAAQGLAQAAEILAGQFILVATNVPYLGRGKHDPALREYCERRHAKAKSDLATCFVERCLEFCEVGGTAGLVAPQNWWFQGTYAHFRRALLARCSISILATLGEEAWQSFGDRGPVAALIGATNALPGNGQAIIAIDSLPRKTIEEKDDFLRKGDLSLILQRDQVANPDSRITLTTALTQARMGAVAASVLGLGTGDFAHYGREFWELPNIGHGWAPQQSTVDGTILFGGRHFIVAWDPESDRIRGMTQGERDQIHNQDRSGRQVWGKRGVAVGLMRGLKATLYSGERFEKMIAVLCPIDPSLLPAIWTYCESDEFADNVRRLDKGVAVANATLEKVPFDAAYWIEAAASRFPHGLPLPGTDDPTQWLFNGDPKASDEPLQVAVARLLGYRWPRQTGSAFSDCPALGPDGLESHADDDGIVCLTPLRGEALAADRLRALLADAYGPEWSSDKQNELLVAADAAGKSLEEWLRDSFFEQHCALFHNRPFVWHIWDGLPQGFSALVNYHRLAAPNGEGRRTLEKLIYTYLGDWIDRQRADQKAGVEGSDGRVAAAQHLKGELEKILEGEPPYDLFVRWKPLHQQALGWDPDLDDGVRLNIRPFMTAKTLNARGKSACILRVPPKSIKWDQDRGKEPSRPKADYPWFWGWDGETSDFAGGSEPDGNRWNDLHYSRAAKLAAREREKETLEGPEAS